MKISTFLFLFYFINKFLIFSYSVMKTGTCSLLAYRVLCFNSGNNSSNKELGDNNVLVTQTRDELPANTTIYTNITNTHTNNSNNNINNNIYNNINNNNINNNNININNINNNINNINNNINNNNNNINNNNNNNINNLNNNNNNESTLNPSSYMNTHFITPLDTGCSVTGNLNKSSCNTNTPPVTTTTNATPTIVWLQSSCRVVYKSGRPEVVEASNRILTFVHSFNIQMPTSNLVLFFIT